MADYACRLHRDQREHNIGVFAQLPNEAEFQRGGESREQQLALMDELIPVLKKRAAGREISGLAVYE